ncbi:unnamed protein product [Closterium sp. NIES-64]|nr:unnamed protein product [Closterium sp. NIES-64]
MFRKNPSGRPHSHTHSDAQSASEEAAGARASSPYTLDPASLSDWLRAHGWRMSNPLPDPAFREQDEEGEEEEGGWGALMKEGAAAAAGDSDSEGAEGAGAGVAGAGTGGANRGNAAAAAAAAAAASASRPVTDSLSADLIPAEANATFLRLLQQQGDYACALWVRNVCYAFNPLFHSVPVANHEIEKIMLRERITDRHVGVWFWKDPRYDLSRLNLSQNICTGKSALQPLRKEHFSSADVRDVPELSGRVGPFVHASDAELFFLHGRPPAHPVPAAAAGTSSSSSGGGGSSSSSGGYSGSAFTTNNASFAISVEQPEEWRGVGMVSLRDGHLGHFVEFIGAMTELASHLPTGKRDRDVPGTQVAAADKDSPGREVASGGGTADAAAAAAAGDSAGSAGAGAGAGDAAGVSGGAAAAGGGDGGKEGDRVDVQPVLFFPSGAGISRWVAAAGAVAMRGPQAMREYQGMRVPQAMREHQGTKDHAGMRGLKGTRQQIKKGELDPAGESGAALAAGGEAVTSAGGTPVAAESTPAVEAGRVWTHTTCFQDAFFPLSIAHAPSSADLFRLWVAQGAGLGKTLKAQQADPRGVEKGVEKGDVGEKNGERKGGGKGGRGSGEGEKKIDKKGRSSGEDKKDEEKGKKNGGSEKKVEKGGRSSEGSEKNANASVSGGERRKGTDKHSERDKGGGNGGNGGNGGKRRNEREDGKEEKAGEKGGDWKISRPGKGGEKKGVISHVSGASVVSTASGVRRAATGRGSMKSHSSRHLLQLQLRKGDLPVRHLKAKGTTNVSSRERQQQQRRQLGHGESGRRAAGRRVAWQITVVERKGVRTISNFRPMVGLLRAVFPHLPVKVVSLEAMPFAAQVRAMHRTALLVSMHGASMANVVLLQKGAAALEIMPYMWHYGAYKRIALRWGVHYFMWRNEHRNLSTYTDNCLDANGFSQWQPAKCHTVTACRACIRDKVVTEVHLGELRSALLAAKEVVDQWELRRGRSFVELSDDLTADG